MFAGDVNQQKFPPAKCLRITFSARPWNYCHAKDWPTSKPTKGWSPRRHGILISWKRWHAMDIAILHV